MTEWVGVRIRRGVVGDAAALAAFAARTFAETFGADNRPEDLVAHLVATYGVAHQARELACADEVTLLADRETSLVAYAQVRRAPRPACVLSPDPVELHRFYVDCPAHGRGVAARLMTTVFDAARELGGRSLWLSVWERNPRALAFYRRMGFADVGRTEFFVGPDRQTDRVMARVLP